ncbi:MAG TPA: hypothetical protein VL551_11695 [Actinospica sp.]|jgi:hypothetical protein|nr:hypothetical protein [Actinospica sp.]
MHRDEHDPEPVARELETGLFLRRVDRHQGTYVERHRSTYLTAEISVRPAHLEPGERADLAFHACCQDQIDHPAAALELEGFEITARYDGRHFYESHHGYRLLHGVIGSRRAQQMARRMRQIDEAFARQAAIGLRVPDRHDYPELVVRIGEIIGTRFVKHRLDPDPAAPSAMTDLPGLADAFERHTPRDRDTAPMPF